MARYGGGVWVVGVGVLAVAGCPGPSDVREDVKIDTPDPWESSVTYTDPDGQFALDFPVKPKLASSHDGPVVVIHSLTATVDDDWEFTLAWSDAPPGTPLVATQDMRPDTAERNAANDGGEVVDDREIELFGRTGVQFTVGNASGGRDRYHDAQLVMGGRLYELTVSQFVEPRRVFDRFLDSFELLQPPVGDASSDFFGVAETACAGFFAGRTPPADDATPAQRGAAVAEVGAFYEQLVAQLETTPVAPDEQGDALAFVDSMRRSVEPARSFAEAVTNDAPNAPDLGRATHSDTDLTSQLAERHDATSCA